MIDSRNYRRHYPNLNPKKAPNNSPQLFPTPHTNAYQTYESKPLSQIYKPEP